VPKIFGNAPRNTVFDSEFEVNNVFLGEVKRLLKKKRNET
jgi:hypothetical protein